MMALKALFLTFFLGLPILVHGADDDVFLSHILLAQAVGVEDPLQITEPSLPEMADLWNLEVAEIESLYIRCTYRVGTLLFEPQSPYDLVEGVPRETLLVVPSVEEAYRVMEELFMEEPPRADPTLRQRTLVRPPIGLDGNPTEPTEQRIGGVTCTPMAQ